MMQLGKICMRGARHERRAARNNTWRMITKDGEGPAALPPLQKGPFPGIGRYAPGDLVTKVCLPLR